MNVYGVAITVALVVDYVLHTAAAVLNTRVLSRPVPDEVASLYGEEGLRRARNYVRAVSWDGFVERSVLLLLVFVFWFSGGFSWLDTLVRQWFTSELLRGLAYLGLLAVAHSAVSIPFDMYRTFVVETRFGFNLTTWQTFVADRVKGLALAVLLGGGLLAGLLSLFLHFGSSAWLWCWVVVVVFSLIIQWLGPSLILPLFNQFEPMPDGELKDAITRYATSVRFPLRSVYLVDGSRRSTRANAYFTGLGRRRRIALFDTLVQKHSTAEIVSVLAHEIGHYRLRHTAKGLLFGAAHAGIALFLFSVLLEHPALQQALLVAEPSLHVGLVGFVLLYTPVETALSALANRLSRKHEAAADRFALDTAPSPESLANAIKHLSAVNLAHPNPHWFHVGLNYSHPPLAQRLHAIHAYLEDARRA